MSKTPYFIQYNENTTITDSDFFYFDNNTDTAQTISYSDLKTQLEVELTSSVSTDFVFINQKTDLPTAVSNVITLEDNITYYFTTTVDLTGDRLVGGENTVILGSSSENSRITSTGLGVGVPLFYTEWTTPIRHVTFQDVDTAIHIVGNVNPPVALDWTGVNFLNVPNIGLIDTCDNWIYSKGAILNSQNLQFSGTVGTVGVDNSIFVGTGSAGNILDILSTCTITRRFRLIYSSMVVFGSTVGVNVDSSATIPVEGYILDTINFSAGGTYTSGVAYTDNKTLFVNNKGVINSAEVSNYYMFNNTTSTTISSSGVAVKILGTTTPNAINQKFTHADNKATYVGAITRDFQVSATATFTSGNNQVIGIYVAKNGTIITDSEMYATTSGSGRAESIHIQTILQMAENDYIEIFIENSTSSTDITVEYLNVITKSLN